MKVCLVNDTSAYHCGCAAVVGYIRHRLSAQGHQLIGAIPRGACRLDPTLLADCEVLLVNGEGTLHHRDRHFLLDALARAQAAGKRTHLVNAVWDRMRGDWGPLLNRLDGLVVREVLSARQLAEQFGVRATVTPDFSYFCPLDEQAPCEDWTDQEVVGDWFAPDPFAGTGRPRLTLQEHGWSSVVRGLRGAQLYLTGRHHGVYAACRARTPFVPYLHNCHKIAGLFASAGVEIPIPTDRAALDRARTWALENRAAYRRLFDWLERQPGWAGV